MSPTTITLTNAVHGCGEAEQAAAMSDKAPPAWPRRERDQVDAEESQTRTYRPATGARRDRHGNFDSDEEKR